MANFPSILLSIQSTWSFTYIAVVVQSFSHVWPFAIPWTAARQASLSFTISWSLLKLMSIKSGMPSNHLVLCGPLFLLPSIFPSISVFSNIYWLYLGLFTYIHIYVYVLCICIYVYIHIHKYICVHTHTYIVYIHTYILHQGLFIFISQLQDLFTYILGTNSVSQPKARNWSHLWIDSKI